MKTFAHFLCESAGRALVNPKGVGFNFPKNLGSYAKTTVRHGRFFFKKVKVSTTEVEVEMTFPYAPGDEKGGFGDNGFATARRILDSILQNGGQMFNKTQNTPESLAFHGTAPVEYNGKTALTQTKMELTFTVKQNGTLGKLLPYLSSTPEGSNPVYVVTVNQKLV